MINLSKPQKLIYDMEKFSGGAIAVICGCMLTSRKTDITEVKHAINEIYRLNDALRIRIFEHGGIISQEIAEYCEQDVDVLHFENKSELNAYGEAIAKTPIDLSGSLCDMKIAILPDQYGVIIKLHHLVGDAWTVSLICNQLSALLSGEIPEAYSYKDYIAAEQTYISSKRYEKDKAFFLEQFKKCDEATYLSEKQSKTFTSERATYMIDREKTAIINEYARQNNASPFLLFITALSIYMNRIKMNAEKFYVGTAVLNRSNFCEKNTAGMFVNTVPVLIELDNQKGFVSNLENISVSMLSVLRHQKFNYDDVLSAIRSEYDFSEKLYDVMLSYQNASVNGTDIKTAWYHCGAQSESLQIHIDDRDNESIFRVHYDYLAEKFTKHEIDILHEHICNLLFDAINNDNKMLYDLEMLSSDEKQKLFHDYNDTAVDYPRNKCVHELISEQAAKTPDKIALVFENEHFTYKQLDEMSNSLAHCLRQKGIKPNDVVLIIAKRDWRIIVAMLGILKAGGAYMPVDPSYPVERIEYMLETANSRIALSYGYSNKLNIETIDLTDFDYTTNTQNIENANSSSDLCYIIFTSGSTGKPKGVALRHSNVTNYCDNNNNNNVCHKIIKSGYESIVSVTNIVFDIFVTESLLPLVNGLTIYFANDEQVFSQQKLSELFSNSKIDVMQTTPTKMRSYIFDKNNVAYLSRLKAIILGGEALPADLYEELKKYTSAEIFNIYGPAETTVWSTNKLIESTDITIGKPIANTQVYILDHDRKPLPIGVAGELCISGDGVGAGYLNRPELTAEKFIPNPFVEGKIMYCTGDLARWREDGEIEYLGRIDTQVKIRGLRIELGEIESVMSTFAGIQLAAVTDKRDENGRQYLVGYYTTDTEIDEKALRAHLAAKLPKYMIPNYLMRLDKMPMTASGKTDRKNLPVPQMTASTVEFVAPQNELESALHRIVTEILETDRIGVTDDFFDFGGDSLRAIEYVAKAHNEGVEFTLQSVFDYPTIRELCGFIDNGEARKVVYSAEDFAKFNEILSGNVIDESFAPVKRSLGNVLLTGATGFLGAHILDSLMKSENGKIYCLVRSQKQDDRRGRLFEILNYYFGNTYDNEIGKRIIPIIGDVEQIGLSDNIPYDVQTVIHTAATVKHYGSYDYFRNVNVLGTENVIAYAQMCKARLIHISTISVSGNSMADEIEVYRSANEKSFDETSLYIGQPLENVYIHSKFEAEIAVLNLVLNGLDAKIVRVGNLTNRQSDFKFQPNYRENAFLTRVKAGLELGLFPDYLLPLYSEFSPIDATADGVVKIAQYADKQNVFHLNSNKPIYFDKLLEVLHELNIRMETVSGREFNDTLQKLAKADNTEYIYEAFQNDMDENGQLVYDSNIRIKNEFTVWFMKKVGFEWKQIDFDYIKGYIEYFRDLGYLEV
ncbi:MAG: amino acid adenylation domain-containing protein [Oscillospiraceae bacterium]|nr:amino acid adenylation domain-containing protein [Oscillospiraceae bacterium]